MVKIVTVMMIALLCSCRGEPVPRDYQNSSPSSPADSKAGTPTAQGQATGSPEPSSGAEGSAGPYDTVRPSTGTATPAPVGNPRPAVPPSSSTTGSAVTSTSPHE
ncbi:MAG TPA: hypothetical protein VNM92_06220 [Thermoanaerobaculia bacterium]|nr:hypothetical protein [Thermoanaerobaculia bacterium]